jgi:peroxiredoxin
MNPMSTRSIRGRVVAIGAAALVMSLLAGVGAWVLLSRPDAGPASRAGAIAGMPAGTPRPAFRLADLEGRMRDVSEWDGKVLVVNFWATWCPPCLREIPHFVAMHDRYAGKGLVVVGIAIDDPERSAAFAREHGISYLVLLGEEDGAEASRLLGNRQGVLPYTVVVDRSGRVSFSLAGEISPETLEGAIKPLL